MMEENTGHKLILRRLRPEDYPDLKAIMETVYSNAGGAWPEKNIRTFIEKFPDGQICIEDKGRVIAVALSLIVDYDKFGDTHTYWEITGKGQLTTHDPDGDTLYGMDVFVHPEFQGMRLGRRLYDARKEICISLNLKRIVAGGRIPNYRNYADKLSPMQYIEQVKGKELYDPILTFQLSNDFHVKKVLKGYLPSDQESQAFATLLEWINLYYEEEERIFNVKKTVARIGVVQWQMRPFKNLSDLMTQAEFFISAIGGYQADFALFPEFFNAPLLSMFQDDPTPDAIRKLAEFTHDIRAQMQDLAISYNLNIITGSMPVYEDKSLYNVSFLCRRDGTWDSQYKLHATPYERHYWGMQGGEIIKAFETDAGRIGILICYDVEFPELCRVLAEKDIQILFVPYWTDTRPSYLRVRRCAQARAIENECYVVITGSMGNLPKVENMDIQYSQSAVFSPSDISFPHDAIIAEATPNTETVLVADLDYDLLRELRSGGTVRNLADRRKDLYQIKFNHGGHAGGG